MEVVSLSKSVTIIELEFHRTDLLGPRMVASSDFRPLTQLRRVHFLNCRLISMHSVARSLPSFRSKMPSFEIVFTDRKPEIDELRSESWHGAVLCHLFLWRHSRPNKFIESMLHDSRFRRYIEHYVGSSADDWYDFVNQPYPTDSNWEYADHELLRKDLWRVDRTPHLSKRSAPRATWSCQAYVIPSLDETPVRARRAMVVVSPISSLSKPA